MNEKEILLKTRDINDTGKDRFFKTNDDSVHHILEKIFKLLDLQKSVEVTEYQGKLVDLFQEDLRFQIFWVLYKNRNKPMTVKQILDECNKKLDILGNDVKGHSDDKKIISAFRRHLGILEKAKFIQDTPIRKANLRNKLYQLSSVGELIIKSMRGTRAILNNIDFINTHDFKNLPDAFVNSIGSLLYCEVIRSELKVIKRIKEVYDKAIEDDLTREFWTLNPIIPEFLTEKAMDFSNKREKKNFVYHQVVPKVVHVSKARTTLINKNRLWINLNQVSVLLRVVDTMTVFMVCNGSEGVLIFQKKDGDIDLSQALYGNTGEFVSLCKTLFYEFWNVGDPFDGKNVKFIDDLE
jgi:predicted transcriptional regulator